MRYDAKLAKAVAERATGLRRPLDSVQARGGIARPPIAQPVSGEGVGTNPGGALYFTLGLSELGGMDELG